MKAVELRPFRVILSAILFASVPVHAAPGDLDATFAQTGFRRTGFGHGDDYGYAMVQQFDGKFVVAGSAEFGGSAFALCRYNTDGSLDASFGESGKVFTSFDGDSAAARTIMIQGDGKLVVVGLAGHRVAIARYNVDGSLDPSFGALGKVLTASGLTFSFSAGAALQADGKIVVTSSYFPFVNNYDFAVLRFNADGTPDVSFHGDGLVVTSFGSGDIPYAVVIQPDGKILAAGTTGAYIAVARIHTDGSLDTTFDGDGKVTTDIGPFGTAQTIGLQVSQVGFKIVVGGNRSSQTTARDFALVRYNSDGSLDTTFGGDGIVVTPVSAGLENDAIEKVGIRYLNGQPSRIVAAGYADLSSNRDFAVAKYFLDGTLDPSFGGDGIVTTAIGSNDDVATAMAIVGGSYVVAGYSRSGSVDGYDCALVRYNADGSLDAAFDGDGKRTDDLGSGAANAGAVVVQPDDKVVAAGYCQGADSTNDFAVARFDAGGSLDPTFGGDGRVTTAIGTGDDEAHAAALQPDGRIVAAGYTISAGTNYAFAVVRYNADGTLDPAFSFDGIQVTPFSSGAFAWAVALQPDGKVILAGSADIGGGEQFALARYAADGSLDASFGTGGKVTTAVGTGAEEGRAIALQPDGKIVVAGYAEVGGASVFAVARYNPNGTLDTSFDGDGIVTTPMEGNFAYAYAAAIQADGKIVLAGYAAGLVAIARYNANGSLDATFDGDGKVTVTVGSVGGGNAVAMQPNGKIVVAGYRYAPSSDFLLLRLLPDGSLDASYGANGTVLVDFDGLSSDLGYAIAMDSEGRAVVAGVSNEVFAVERVLGDGATTAAPEGPLAAAAFQLGMPRPNPARYRTEITFNLATPGPVMAQVFDVSGRLVREIVRARFEAGPHSLVWDGRDNTGAFVSSGVYFVRTRAGAHSESRRVTLLR